MKPISAALCQYSLPLAIGLTLATISSSNLFAQLGDDLAQEAPEPGKQVQVLPSKSDQDLPHLFYLPDDYDSNPDKSWPLVLFLHGRGESNGPLPLVAKWGPPRFAKRGDSLPFILVSPQCPRSGSWSDETRQTQLVDLLQQVIKSYRVDQSRIYLTGLSMGGFGSWTLAANHPHQFAAVIPICGGGNPKDAKKLTDLPIWVFHGDQDKSVPLSESVEMVEAIQEAGGKRIRFTTLEHVGHNSWSSAYALPELFPWMLSFRIDAKRN